MKVKPVFKLLITIAYIFWALHICTTTVVLASKAVMVESNNLIVFPLSPNVTNDHLIEIFSNYGTILNATITNETQVNTNIFRTADLRRL